MGFSGIESINLALEYINVNKMMHYDVPLSLALTCSVYILYCKLSKKN